MTSVSFNKKLPLVIVPVSIKSGASVFDFNFAVDTGASVTLVDMEVLRAIGYGKEQSIRTIQTMTASRQETAYEFEISNIKAIGLIRRNFRVISRSLPAGLGIDGLLGLNFFKNKELVIDFKSAEIKLT
jgi:aspartyl protease family protein